MNNIDQDIEELEANKDTYTHGYFYFANNITYGNGINGVVVHIDINFDTSSLSKIELSLQSFHLFIDFKNRSEFHLVFDYYLSS